MATAEPALFIYQPDCPERRELGRNRHVGLRSGTGLFAASAIHSRCGIRR